MNSRETLQLLRDYESRNITFMDPHGGWPIVWGRACGTHVWDPEGKKYLDLTAAFGVAAAGHANPRVVAAGQRQMATLLHAMGDVHPHEQKARLVRELSRLTFERWSNGERSGKTILCNSGFEAVEAALKTVRLATGRPGIVAFEAAYHGLGYGTLNATHRAHFRGPFRNQLRGFAHFLPFPKAASSRQELAALEDQVKKVLRKNHAGAVLVEPVQVRGGINVPPGTFLPMLRRVCDDFGALLVLDEIYTGFGRTGEWFACEHWETVPDLICLGKALTGGFPLSACVGKAQAMDAAWPASNGEAIHTSTYLGHPVGCAMALAQIAEVKRLKLVLRSRQVGKQLFRELQELQLPEFDTEARGLGLLAGLELRLRNGKPATERVVSALKAMLHQGFVLLPEGEHANVISFSPPLTITPPELTRTVQALKSVLSE